MSEYDDRVKAGEIDMAEAQKRPMQQIKNLRYNDDDYFWINDPNPKMILYPIEGRTMRTI